jgi:hypothetical protein
VEVLFLVAYLEWLLHRVPRFGVYFVLRFLAGFIYCPIMPAHGEVVPDVPESTLTDAILLYTP